MEVKGIEKIVARLDKLSDTNAMEQAVTKACLIVETDAKRNCPVDDGRLRGSISSEVNNTGTTIEGIVGTNVEYAPYVEYGTGLFSSEGNGRKDVPWKYKDDKGKWHTTSGQHPQPYLHPALTENRTKIIKILEEGMKK